MNTSKIIFKNIKKYGYEKGIPMLIKGLDSKDPNLRKVALEALRTISGKRYDPLSYLWRAWWKDSKENLLADGGTRITAVIESELAKEVSPPPSEDTQMIGVALEEDQTVAMTPKDAAQAWAGTNPEPPPPKIDPTYNDPGLEAETQTYPGQGDPFGSPAVQVQGQPDPFAAVGGDPFAPTVLQPGVTGETTASGGWKDTVADFAIPYTTPDRPAAAEEAQKPLSPEEIKVMEFVRRIQTSDYRYVIPKLIEQIHHPDPDKRKRVVMVLEKLTGKEHGEDKVAWEKWWDEAQFLTLEEIRVVI